MSRCKCRTGLGNAIAISVFHVLSQSVVTSYGWWSGKFSPTGTWQLSGTSSRAFPWRPFSLISRQDNHIALDHLTVEIFRVIVPRTVHLSGHSGHRDANGNHQLIRIYSNVSEMATALQQFTRRVVQGERTRSLRSARHASPAPQRRRVSEEKKEADKRRN